jgi:hypothetical protein
LRDITKKRASKEENSPVRAPRNELLFFFCTPFTQTGLSALFTIHYFGENMAYFGDWYDEKAECRIKGLRPLLRAPSEIPPSSVLYIFETEVICLEPPGCRPRPGGLYFGRSEQPGKGGRYGRYY